LQERRWDVSTAIVDVDIQQLPVDLRLDEGRDEALVLIRVGDRPVGQVVVPVRAGLVHGDDLRDAVVCAGGWLLWEAWLHDHLKWSEALGIDSAPSEATVAICTRDRPDHLRRCLAAVASMPDDGQEVLVVDNCPSTDASRRVVQEYPEVRYVVERRPGLDIARNRALRESHGKVVAFTDDDALPDRGWLRALLRNFADPLVLGVTGLTMPMELETQAQRWFEKRATFCRGFKRTVFDWHNVNPLGAGRVGAGANLAIRKSAFDLVGPFDERLDAGTPTCSGGDNDMLCRILAAGYRVVYDPAALNWHCHRREWTEVRRTLYGYGVGVSAFWTKRFACDRELSVPKLGARWFWRRHVRGLAASLLGRPGSGPVALVVAELWGCLVGPLAFMKSHWKSRGDVHSHATS
jgi:glycosyltransferase involved in cell wall biosynthesis